MAMVYIVRSIYHEQYSDPAESPYASDVVSEVFDSMEKAVGYIRERFEIDHWLADAALSIGGGQLFKRGVKCEITAGVPVEVYEYMDDEIHVWQHYMVNPYIVK